MIYKLILFISTVALLSCTTRTIPETQFFKASQKEYSYTGRTEKRNDSVHALISPAAGVQFKAAGDSITFLLSSAMEPHNYVVVELNGTYHDRYQVQKDSINRITVALPKEKNSVIGLYKATEASNGSILFYGVETGKIGAFNPETVATIEYIGDSITCGFGADTTDIPCDTGTWYDQHNAYLAYGPLTARALHAGYRLSSVSGMGIYRNWNDENLPVMGDVYATTYLDGNTSKKWQFSGKKPDLVSICLGTNDLSDGDGEKVRESFDAKKYTAAYTAFVEHIFTYYPETKLALLTSPMISGEKATVLLKCLQQVKENFEADHTVAIFEFDPMKPSGCNYHPDLTDHRIMADQLLPFYNNLLKK